MPYLQCPSCRLETFSRKEKPHDAACPRCGSQLAASARPLFAARLERKVRDVLHPGRGRRNVRA